MVILANRSSSTQAGTIPLPDPEVLYTHHCASPPLANNPWLTI
jgi:hypothetical protein